GIDRAYVGVIGKIEGLAQELKPVTLTEQQPLRKAHVDDVRFRLLISVAVGDRHPVRAAGSVKGSSVDDLLDSSSRRNGERAGGAANTHRVWQPCLHREGGSQLKVVGQITPCPMETPGG